MLPNVTDSMSSLTCPQMLNTEPYHWVGWRSGNPSELYSGSTLFRSWSGHPIPTEDFRVFQARQVSLLNHDHFFPNPFQVVIRRSATRHCMLYPLTVSQNNRQNKTNRIRILLTSHILTLRFSNTVFYITFQSTPGSHKGLFYRLCFVHLTSHCWFSSSVICVPSRELSFPHRFILLVSLSSRTHFGLHIEQDIKYLLIQNI
jgi:hypothetical protein